MKLRPFKLERYFAKYEFSVKYLLSSSDCDGLSQKRLINLADEETRSLWENLSLGYTESQGLPLLREEIAKLYRTIDANQVIVLAPEEGVFLALNAILEPGDHVICTFPGYQSLYEIAVGLGCEVTRWLPDETQGWRFDPEFLLDAIQPKTKLLVINFPHNPTGYLPSVEDFRRMIDIAKQHGLTVLSDEMYRFLELDKSARPSSAADLYENAITLFGMSKTFGLAGLRIGWLVTRNRDLLAQITTLRDYTTICSSASSEALALIGLRARQTLITENVQLIGDNLQLLSEFMARNDKLFSWVKPKAGTICFPRLNAGLSAEQFCKAAVEKAGILLLPSTVYDYGDQHVRIGFGRKNLPEVLEKFETYLSEPVT